jgi:hypothetical protein
MPVTKIADVIVPERFTPYVQQLTEEKSELIQSGVIGLSAQLNADLNGGGLTFNQPSFQDLTNDVENVASDDDATNSSPKKIVTSREIQVRLSRNQSWSSMDLTSDLAGTDPMAAIGNRVGYYWSRRLQAAAIATIQGIFADNDAAPSASEHVQYDLTNNVSGGGFVDGVTNFTTEAFIDTTVTMGDSSNSLGAILVHSIVYARMKKNNLIDYIPDARGEVNIPTFQGLRVIVDDALPNPAGVAGLSQTSAGIYHSWLMGAGAVVFGQGQPKTPTEVIRVPSAGNGAGQETLFNRVEWAIHPVGHKYAGTPPSGGPSNAATSNNLGAAGSWQRVFPERKQIKIARLITREV